MESGLPGFADIVFADGPEGPLTYRLPEPLRPLARPGVRAVVPLGPRAVTGYVVAVHDRAPAMDLKAVAEIPEAEPLLDGPLLELTRWVADYYLTGWGGAIRAALPPGIDSLSRRTAALTEAGQSALAAPATLRPGEREILGALAARAAIPLPTLQRLVPGAGSLLRGLEQRGLVRLGAEVRPPRIRVQRLSICSLAAGVEAESAPLSPRADKQRAILRALAADPEGLPRAEAAAGAPAALAALVKRGLVAVREVEVSRDPFAAPADPSEGPRRLTGAQAEALAAIREPLAARRFQPILLHGVTGSGKTEVYLQAVEAALAAGGQALVLVPEIALAPLTVRRFLARFGGRVAVLHSGLAGGERFDAWRRIRSGGADIVIGARSAVFAPLPRLGILVVDEEHDPSYKQEEAPRYHGRDVAVMRAKQLGIPVVLGSATPAFESLARAQAGGYRLARLPERIESRPLPAVEVVDLRRVAAADRMLSPRLAEALGERLARGEQSLLFLNRRGFSTLLLCPDCGETLGCPRCSVALTFHAPLRRLCCHTCDFTRRPPDQCPHCQSTRLRFLGTGTQQVEAAVRERFPRARVARLDRDTARQWRAGERILAALAAGEIDVLVGTQMIGKGHDVPNVTLVGVVAADMALNLPDFRAGERAFALFTQVVGRAGRGDRPGLALIQSFNPGHYILRAVQAQDAGALWEAESPLRREQGLPPFGRAILAVLSSPEERPAEEAAAELARLLGELGVRPEALGGPAPAPLYKLRSRYRWQLLVRDAEINRLHQRVWEAARRLKASPPGRKARLDLDVDPASLC